MRILILGGTGAMGVHLVEALSESEGCSVWVTSRSGHEDFNNIHFICGNARDLSFLIPLLRQGFDVIVDFMNYDYDEFRVRFPSLLNSTGHYIWFSSCRVYANSPYPLNERSPRLLETSSDMNFLATNRYALRKARQEDLLLSSNEKNYTIIRPYITYSENRLQLGVYEKEQWLYRILKGHSVVINKAILNRKTTLTYGKDVADAVRRLMGQSVAYGKIVQIAARETIYWKDVLSLYSYVIREHTGIVPRVYLCEHMSAVDELYEGGYNTIYDRVWDRVFDSSYIDEILGESISYMSVHEGLRNCLCNFLQGRRCFHSIDWQYEAYQDMMTGEYTPQEDMPDNISLRLYNGVRNADIKSIPGLNGKLELYPVFLE